MKDSGNSDFNSENDRRTLDSLLKGCKWMNNNNNEKEKEDKEEERELKAFQKKNKIYELVNISKKNLFENKKEKENNESQSECIIIPHRKRSSSKFSKFSNISGKGKGDDSDNYFNKIKNIEIEILSENEFHSKENF